LRYFLLFFLLLPSCALMPGNTLFEGLKEPSRLEEIEDYSLTNGQLTSSLNCNRLLMEHEQYGLMALNLIGSAGFALGCADVHADFTTGKVDKCHIYAAFDADFIIKHEQRHCMGYQDVLY